LITTSPVEEKILARATDKRNLNGLVVEAGKFNNSSSGTGGGGGNASGKPGKGGGPGGAGGGGGDDEESNREMMESLLKEWSAGGAEAEATEDGEVEDAEVPDDEQINEMMSIHDSELVLYQKMDKERAEQRATEWKRKMELKGLKGSAMPPLPAALMGEDEKPPWLQPHSWIHKHAMIEATMNGTAHAGGKKGRGRKPGKSLGGIDAMPFDADGLDGGDYDLDGEDGAVMVAGKMMRKRKEVTYDDGLTDKQFTRLLEKSADNEELLAKQAKLQNRRGGGGVGGGGGMPADITEAVSQVLKDVGKLKRPDGTLLCELFKDKPDKKIYPDYYQLVAKPISLKEIALKLKKGMYSCLEDVETDFALMSHNARTFNLDTSPVFWECEQLRGEFHSLMNMVRERFDLGPPPNPANRQLAKPMVIPGITPDEGVLESIPGLERVAAMYPNLPHLPEYQKGHAIYNPGSSAGAGVGASRMSMEGSASFSSTATAMDDTSSYDGYTATATVATKTLTAASSSSSSSSSSFSAKKSKLSFANTPAPTPANASYSPSDDGVSAVDTASVDEEANVLFVKLPRKNASAVRKTPPASRKGADARAGSMGKGASSAGRGRGKKPTSSSKRATDYNNDDDEGDDNEDQETRDEADSSPPLPAKNKLTIGRKSAVGGVGGKPNASKGDGKKSSSSSGGAGSSSGPSSSSSLSLTLTIPKKKITKRDSTDSGMDSLFDYSADGDRDDRDDGDAGSVSGRSGSANKSAAPPSRKGLSQSLSPSQQQVGYAYDRGEEEEGEIEEGEEEEEESPRRPLKQIRFR
jgi:hypothetical protein